MNRKERDRPDGDSSRGGEPDEPMLPLADLLDPARNGSATPAPRIGAWSLVGAGDLLRWITARHGDSISRRCAARIGERALLLDEGRVLAKSLARAAFAMRRVRDDRPIEDWIDGCIDEAIRDTVREAERDDALGVSDGAGLPPVLAQLAQVLGLEAGLAPKAALVFNGLPLRIRRAFHVVAIEARSVADYSADAGVPPAEVDRRVKVALRSIALLRPVDLLPEDGGPDGP